MNKARSEHIKTMFVFPEVTTLSFGSTMPHLDYSEDSRTTNRFILLNAGLGNRAPLKDGRRLKSCPLCNMTLNEVHILVECGLLEPVRRVLGIRDFIDKQIDKSSTSVYKEFWNIWAISKETRDKRAHAARKLLEAYLETVQ